MGDLSGVDEMTDRVDRRHLRLQRLRRYTLRLHTAVNPRRGAFGARAAGMDDSHIDFRWAKFIGHVLDQRRDCYVANATGFAYMRVCSDRYMDRVMSEASVVTRITFDDIAARQL